MKKLITTLFVLISFFLSTCKKNNTPPDSLPPVTKTGANTFGCKINGEVWVPYYPCVAFGNPCQEMQLDIFSASDTSVFPLNISFGFGRSDNNKKSFFEGRFQASSIGNKYDSLIIEYSKDTSLIPYNKIYGSTGSFEVTKFDTTDKIISGIFNFTLSDGLSIPDSVIITDGRFDFQLQSLCKCTQ